MNRVHFRIEDDLIEKIDRIAADKKLTRSRVLRDIIELGLETFEVKERFNITSLYGKDSKTQVEKYSILAGIESLYLLREIAETIDHKLVEKAMEKRQEVVGDNW